MDFTQYRAAFFDIYATLIDWEPAIIASLGSLTQQLPAGDGRRQDTRDNRVALLQAYAASEKAVEHEHPAMPYPQILGKVYERLAEQYGVASDPEDAAAFGRSIGGWPAFPDTVDAMRRLGKHLKLFALSNVDDASIARTMAGPLKGFDFDGIYTAEAIGSYKPDPRNYKYCLEKIESDFGFLPNECFLVAQSLDIDHVASHALGLQPGLWIARKGAAMGGDYEKLRADGTIGLGATFHSLAEFADAVDESFSNS